MHSFTHDLTCVSYLLLSETMQVLQVPPGRGGRREAFKLYKWARLLVSIMIGLWGSKVQLELRV